MLSKLQQTAYSLFGSFTQKHVSERLKHDVEAAHLPVKPDAYMATSMFISLIAGVCAIVVAIVLYFLFFPLLFASIPSFMLYFTILLPFLVFGLAYLVFLSIPGSKAKTRGKRIDANLSYALNFVAAMSSAGVTPTEIFKSLSTQSIYGEVKNEASWIYRDVSLMGKDIITAIKENIKRTPSERFKEFLQGLIVTVTSGGSLKTYFSSKANQYMVENRQRLRGTIESLGIMAESYVTAAVAGILLLLIVIPLMMIISGSTDQFNFLYLIIFILIPIVHIGFAYVIWMMTVEV